VKKIIEVENLNFNYSINGGKNFTLAGISFNIDEGDFISIIGRNGSGKSTLIKLLSRIYLNYSGKIFYNGNEIHKIERKQFSRNTAYIPQATLLQNEELTVEEFLFLGRYAYKNFNDFTFNDRDLNIVTESLEVTNSASLRKKRLHEISGGEKQKILLTLALVQLDITGDLMGKVIIIDEPITYLDINHQYEIFHLLKKLQHEKGLTVLIVIHDLNLAYKFSDKTLLIDNGKLIRYDETKNVVTEAILKDYFLIDSKITSIQNGNSVHENFINFISQ
jgi:iron complex transport system ATP-binding protein